MLWLAIDDVIALMCNSVCFGMILLEVGILEKAHI